jgi:crossover junction endodeoxyribonuclease RuvC
MLILGVDPGTIVTGYGIIEADKNTYKHVLNGCIKLHPSKNLPEKLAIIYDTLCSIIIKHKPDEFAIETAFYGKNVQSAMKIGYARGVSILASFHHNLPVQEYSPREVKKSVVGNGAATKEQVGFMVNSILCIKHNVQKLDESDALAVALCHAFRLKTPVNSKGNWKSFIEKYPERIIES